MPIKILETNEEENDRSDMSGPRIQITDSSNPIHHLSLFVGPGPDVSRFTAEAENHDSHISMIGLGAGTSYYESLPVSTQTSEQAVEDESPVSEPVSNSIFPIHAPDITRLPRLTQRYDQGLDFEAFARAILNGIIALRQVHLFVLEREDVLYIVNRMIPLISMSAGSTAPGHSSTQQADTVDGPMFGAHQNRFNMDVLSDSGLISALIAALLSERRSQLQRRDPNHGRIRFFTQEGNSTPSGSIYDASRTTTEEGHGDVSSEDIASSQGERPVSFSPPDYVGQHGDLVIRRFNPDNYRRDTVTPRTHTTDSSDSIDPYTFLTTVDGRTVSMVSLQPGTSRFGFLPGSTQSSNQRDEDVGDNPVPNRFGFNND